MKKLTSNNKVQYKKMDKTTTSLQANYLHLWRLDQIAQLQYKEQTRAGKSNSERIQSVMCEDRLHTRE